MTRDPRPFYRIPKDERPAPTIPHGLPDRVNPTWHPRLSGTMIAVMVNILPHTAWKRWLTKFWAAFP